MKRQRQCILWLCVLTVLLCISCGSGTGQAGERDLRISPELTYSGSMDLVCAEKFAVDYYEEGYALVTIAEDGRYLLVPEGHASACFAMTNAIFSNPLCSRWIRSICRHRR